jgi:hypothetical protein
MTIPYTDVSFYSKSGNIEDELGISNPSRLDLNDSRVRTLTGYSGSGSYNDMSALRGKSSFTPTTYTLTTSSSGSFTVPNFCTKIQVLMIGGGGGGGSNATQPFWDGGGGGGAGAAALSVTISVSSGQSITYSVGAGGAGNSTGGKGTNGSCTSITIAGTTYYVNGGGGGGGSHTSYSYQVGLNGGCGGGSCGTNATIDGSGQHLSYNTSSGETIYYFPGGTSSIGSAPGWTTYGNGGAPSADNGLNGGGGGIGTGGNGLGGATLSSGGATGGAGLAVTLGGTTYNLGGGGGAGGSYTNNPNDDPDGSYLSDSGTNINTVYTNNFRSGGRVNGITIGGTGGVGSAGGASVTSGTNGATNTGSGGGGGGGSYPNGSSQPGGNGADGVIYIYAFK